jgi:Bax inhibitor 1
MTQARPPASHSTVPSRTVPVARASLRDAAVTEFPVRARAACRLPPCFCARKCLPAKMWAISMRSSRPKRCESSHPLLSAACRPTLISPPAARRTSNRIWSKCTRIWQRASSPRPPAPTARSHGSCRTYVPPHPTNALGVVSAHSITHAQSVFLYTLTAIGLMFGLVSMAVSGAPAWMRAACLAAFGFCEGLVIGPLVNAYEQESVMAALASTACVFVGFSFAALVSERRSFLYLGGPLASGLSALMFFSFINMFFRSSFAMGVELVFGLGLFSAYVIYDTQLIIERARMHAERDPFMDALNLFLDAINIFVRLLILFGKLKGEGENKSSKRSTTR